MYALDETWDQVVDAALAQRFGELRGAALHQAVMDLSTAYNTPRGEGEGGPGAALQTRAALAARLAFFLRADLLKSAVCLSECEAAGVVWPEQMTVLDVGAGLGAASFGVLEHLASRPEHRRVRIVALDNDPAALEIGLALHKAMLPRFPGTSFEPRLWNANRASLPGTDRYDLIVAQNVLCELPNAPDALVRALIEALDPAGTLLIIEPALRETSRKLHALRDRLVAAGHVMLAPCTRGGSCPALADPRDWCHEDRNLTASPGLARMTQAIGLRRGGLKFSYLALRPDGTTLGRAAGIEAPHRVVSEPLVSKGKRELMVCGADGKRRLTLLDRARSETNQELLDAERGDLIGWDTLDDKGRVSPATRVTRWSIDEERS